MADKQRPDADTSMYNLQPTTECIKASVRRMVVLQLLEWFSFYVHIIIWCYIKLQSLHSTMNLISTNAVTTPISSPAIHLYHSAFLNTEECCLWTWKPAKRRMATPLSFYHRSGRCSEISIELKILEVEGWHRWGLFLSVLLGMWCQQVTLRSTKLMYANSTISQWAHLDANSSMDFSYTNRTTYLSLHTPGC